MFWRVALYSPERGTWSLLPMLKGKGDILLSAEPVPLTTFSLNENLTVIGLVFICIFLIL